MLSVSTVSHQNEQPCQTGWYLLQHPQVVSLDDEGLVGFSDCIETVNAALEHLFFEQHAGKKGFGSVILTFRSKSLANWSSEEICENNSTFPRCLRNPLADDETAPGYSQREAILSRVIERITFAKDQNCTNQSYHRTATARI